MISNVSSVNTYPGRPGYHTPGPTGLPFTKVTFAQASTTWKPQITKLPLSPGTRDDCYRYFDGSQMQTNISGTFFRHQCDLAASVYDVTLEELLVWNPDLGSNANTTSCSFRTGIRYCERSYIDHLPPPVAGPDFVFPLRVSCSMISESSLTTNK